jgi:hypothetical protein
VALRLCGEEFGLEPGVEEEFAVAFGAEDGGVDYVCRDRAQGLHGGADFFYGLHLNFGIADDAAFAYVLASGFELGFD